jgi:hypothetical protein
MLEECANPLLLGWIKEWLDQARERNSKGVTVFGRLDFTDQLIALTSMQLQKSL